MRRIFVQAITLKEKTNTMTTRNSIIAELETIETQLKNMNVDCDQYGNFEKSSKYNELSEREDELMEMLNEFPL